MPSPVVRALYFLLAAGGLPSLTRLEYCVKGSDAAAARASARGRARGATAAPSGPLRRARCETRARRTRRRGTRTTRG